MVVILPAQPQSYAILDSTKPSADPIGVGLDAWGNYIGDFRGLGNGCAEKSPFPYQVRNNVTLRGPGDGYSGYCLLAHTPVDDTKQHDFLDPTGISELQGKIHSDSGPEAAIRNVRVSVSPGDFPEVKVDVDFSGTKTNYQQVIDYKMDKKAPPTYKFGFSGSTGDFTDVHLISNVSIRSIDSLEELHLVKQVDNTDTQPDAYSVGDTVPYQFVVTNTGAESVTDIKVTDPLIANISCPAKNLGPAGGATASMVCTGSLVLTEAQASDPSGKLVNTATATGTSSLGSQLSSTSQATVAVVAPVKNAALSLAKSAKLNDLNGNGLADAGETIDYSFVVENTGNVTVTGVSVSDPMLSGVTCEKDSLAPGESTTCAGDAPYTVTEADVVAGSVKNVATANGTPPEGVDPVDPPTDEVVTPTVPPAAHLLIQKTATVLDRAQSAPAEVGDQISYGFVVTNDGNVTLSGVEVSDPLVGEVVCEKTVLAPSESTSCSANTYTVTEQDSVAGFVLNVAVANASAPEGVKPPEEAKGEARVEVIPRPMVAIRPRRRPMVATRPRSLCPGEKPLRMQRWQRLAAPSR
ncbi:DUF11 domain-containing protein [Leucobacter insecticola]|uniref:DUF11 domain-containing protein n=1 Tax=Leucobacter insecticola TaxID=2714934 RepID=A0A6G8FJ42_9MICO|nr:DUF11 domain-containing protein [Leucobacter insecticola]QIM16371.1 DUF11 domain-containing protein [Leucobacter insecticola]